MEISILTSHYMEDKRMDTVFRIYNPDLKYEVYLLDDWGATEDGKVSKRFQNLRLRGLGTEPAIVSLYKTLTATTLLRAESLCSRPSRSSSGKILKKKSGKTPPGPGSIASSYKSSNRSTLPPFVGFYKSCKKRGFQMNP